jgi:hypothetical protein
MPKLIITTKYPEAEFIKMLQERMKDQVGAFPFTQVEAISNELPSREDWLKTRMKDLQRVIGEAPCIDLTLVDLLDELADMIRTYAGEA